jgi:coenzyme PQQ precursor peptide PqqA
MCGAAMRGSDALPGNTCGEMPMCWCVALPAFRRRATWIWLQATQAQKKNMTWTTPTIVEICIGLEINGYLPAEF